MLATKSEINKILKDMRSAIDGKKFIALNRKKNIDTLSKLGITWKDALAEIYSLSQNDYHSGPLKDRDRPKEDDLWIFKKRFMGELIYIKFKIEYLKSGHIKIVSFHLNDSF